MFITSDSLQVHYGIDADIATFFVDREPPTDNLYWHEKLLYLRPAPGYLFIPLIVDILFKAGIDKQQLLSNEFVTTMEQIGHISALEEIGQITNEEAINKCVELVKDRCKSEDYFNDLVDYFNGKSGNAFKALSTPYQALHRGDFFLFAVCMLNFPNSLTVTIVEQWFALITTLLLLDDIEDLQIDKATGDENALLEAGLTGEGIQSLLNMVQENLRKIGQFNNTMAVAISKQYEKLVETNPVFQQINQA